MRRCQAMTGMGHLHPYAASSPIDCREPYCRRSRSCECRPFPRLHRPDTKPVRLDKPSRTPAAICRRLCLYRVAGGKIAEGTVPAGELRGSQRTLRRSEPDSNHQSRGRRPASWRCWLSFAPPFDRREASRADMRPARCHAVLMVRIHLPPAASLVRTKVPRRKGSNESLPGDAGLVQPMTRQTNLSERQLSTPPADRRVHL